MKFVRTTLVAALLAASQRALEEAKAAADHRALRLPLSSRGASLWPCAPGSRRGTAG
jgi:hypothetical protein